MLTTIDTRRMGAKDVDHFIPWIRWPNNAVENLVLADRRCNNNKRHHLAAAPHLQRWLDRQHQQGQVLEQAAHRVGWQSASARSEAIARSCYTHIPIRTPLWMQVDLFVPADAAVTALFAKK